MFATNIFYYCENVVTSCKTVSQHNLKAYIFSLIVENTKRSLQGYILPYAYTSI